MAWGADGGEAAGEEVAGKRARTEEEADGQAQGAPPAAAEGQVGAMPGGDVRAAAEARGAMGAEPARLSLSKAFAEVRGHTSYLTFAVLLPASVRAAAAAAAPGESAAATPPVA